MVAHVEQDSMISRVLKISLLSKGLRKYIRIYLGILQYTRRLHTYPPMKVVVVQSRHGDASGLCRRHPTVKRVVAYGIEHIHATRKDVVIRRNA